MFQSWKKWGGRVVKRMKWVRTNSGQQTPLSWTLHVSWRHSDVASSSTSWSTANTWCSSGENLAEKKHASLDIVTAVKATCTCLLRFNTGIYTREYSRDRRYKLKLQNKCALTMHSSQAVAQSVFRVGRFVNGRGASKRDRLRGSTASLLLERYECVVRVNLLWYVCKSIEAAGTWKHTSQDRLF